MGITITIHQSAIGLVREESLAKPIGTAFCFLLPHWVVTAKHVVMDYGEPRRRLTFVPNKARAMGARVLFAHPEVDLAVLEVEQPICDRPLYPGHHTLAGAKGLIFAGYAPSKPQASGQPSIYVNEIPQFQVQVRERGALSEDTILFAAPDAEGGHSGGPVFGEGGGVVGAVINRFHDGSSFVAQATSLAPLLAGLRFERGAD
jgi:Trypsin-like peptidase domain